MPRTVTEWIIGIAATLLALTAGVATGLALLQRAAAMQLPFTAHDHEATAITCAIIVAVITDVSLRQTGEWLTSRLARTRTEG